MKVLANDKLNFAKVLISLFDKVENIVGIEANAFTHSVFKRLLSLRHLKWGLCGKDFRNTEIKSFENNVEQDVFVKH